MFESKICSIDETQDFTAQSKYSDAQIMNNLKQAEGCVPVIDLCGEHGISSASHCKGCSKYEGMDASLMARSTKLD